MNFFGHAHVARREREDAGFVLGAMLPDFASICRARLMPHEHEALAAGIAMHHRTDDAFHGAPTFVRLCAETSLALEADGFGLGPARAVAHVGIEMLLDGLLLDHEESCEWYLAGVRATDDDALFSHLRFHGDGLSRFRTLRDRVRHLGLPRGYRDPDFVAERLVGILSSRPRLALDARSAERLGAHVRALRPVVIDAHDALMGEVARGLGSGLGATVPGERHVVERR